MSKLASREEVIAECDRRRALGKIKIGFTSGTFDILHAGHLKSFEEAKKRCDLLVVGVNSDSSVKLYKGPDRPINPESPRASLVAALEAVDFVFLFSERNTNESIRLLRPDIYIKGGDYVSEDKLTSAPIVRGYGGEVYLVPPVPGMSTSGIIEKIVDNYQRSITNHIELPPYEKRPAVFLDRDGTIIKHVDYLHEPERIEFLPDVFPALKRMHEAGVRLVVVTNQPGIGTGYFTKDDFFKVNKKFLTEANHAGVKFDRILFCPHSVGDSCGCRKPEPGLLLRAQAELNIDMTRSFMIGDMTTDVEAGFRAGCRTILLRSGFGGSDKRSQTTPDYIVENLLAAADLIESSLASSAPLQQAS